MGYMYLSLFCFISLYIYFETIEMISPYTGPRLGPECTNHNILLAIKIESVKKTAREKKN